MPSEAEWSCRYCGGSIVTPASRCPYCRREIMSVCPECKRYVDNAETVCPECGIPLTRIADVASRLGKELRLKRPEPPPAPTPPRGLLGRLVHQVRTWQPLAPIEDGAVGSEEMDAGPIEEAGPSTEPPPAS